ncbi:MAG: hypothetical protein AAFP86_01020 [Planctomycetota bacterium]
MRNHTALTCGVLLSLTGASALASPAPIQDDRRDPPGGVPVTIEELDVAAAIAEFQSFKERLGTYRDEISKGRSLAQETSQILADLRRTATPENGFNEEAILAAVAGYVDQVLGAQVELVDFLESQRYRITYYAGKMAASVRPEDLALLFGTLEQNDVALESSVKSVDAASRNVRAFVDTLPANWFDKRTFRATSAMPRETREELNRLVSIYQAQKNGVELAKKRLQLVRAAQRGGQFTDSQALEIDSDLLVGQMFGALDRIRLQMSMDLLALEQLLTGYARSARTQGILDAFQSLVELQGDLEGPSPELSGVLDWLQDSSVRRLSLSASGLARPGLEVPRSSDLLREAYGGALKPEGPASNGGIR